MKETAEGASKEQAKATKVFVRLGFLSLTFCSSSLRQQIGVRKKKKKKNNNNNNRLTAHFVAVTVTYS